MVMSGAEMRSSGVRDWLFAIRGTLVCAAIVLFFDVIYSGSFLLALFVCPIWFIIAIVRAACGRPSRGVAAAWVLIPVITWLLVVANNSLQYRIATGNAARLIQACEQYREANGDYPQHLDDLV